MDATNMQSQGREISNHRWKSVRKNASVSMLGGGADKLDKQRAAGKLTARERIEALVDPRQLPGDWAVREASRDAVRHGGQGHAGRWRGYRRGVDGRPAGAPRQPGFHGRGRIGGRSPLRQGRRDDAAGR